jgi:hypothetical protein
MGLLSEEMDSTSFWNQKLALQNYKKKFKNGKIEYPSNFFDKSSLGDTSDLEFNQENLNSIMVGKKISWGMSADFICKRILILENSESDKKIRLQFIQIDSPRSNPISLIVSYFWHNNKSRVKLKIHKKDWLDNNTYLNLEPTKIEDVINIQKNIDNVFFTAGEKVSEYRNPVKIAAEEKYYQNTMVTLNTEPKIHKPANTQLDVPKIKNSAEPKVKPEPKIKKSDITTKVNKSDNDKVKQDIVKTWDDKKIEKPKKSSIDPQYHLDMQRKRQERELAKQLRKDLNIDKPKPKPKIDNKPKITRDPSYIEKDIPITSDTMKNTSDVTKKKDKQSKLDNLQSYFDSIL